ncbi:hypothetical protein L1887_58541 [Cichorium endivia]|nr:hypothetical protein L1887_58541 [Cichorium endivia]
MASAFALPRRLRVLPVCVLKKHANRAAQNGLLFLCASVLTRQSERAAAMPMRAVVSFKFAKRLRTCLRFRSAVQEAVQVARIFVRTERCRIRAVRAASS